MTDNPYAAPVSDVESPSSPRDFQLHDARSVGIGRGFGWISEGFGHFKQDPGQWILISIVGFVIMIALSMLPLINILSSLLTYVWVGGLMLGCKSQDDGERLSLSYLFAGFSHRPGPLILLGVIFSVAAIVIMLVAMGPLYGDMVVAGMSGDTVAMEQVFAEFELTDLLLSILIGSLFMIPLAMLFWFAPMLIVLNGVPLFKAMGMSFKGCIKNILPFFLYGLVMIVLYIVAALPLFLGMLVLVPTAFASMYRAYKDIYID